MVAAPGPTPTSSPTAAHGKGDEQPSEAATPASGLADRYARLGQLFASVLERAWDIYANGHSGLVREPVVITGASLGLPGPQGTFDEGNVGRILAGEQFIEPIPDHLRQAVLDKHITRLVKRDDGVSSFDEITSVDDVIKLAGRTRPFDLVAEFGISADRVSALDTTSVLAIAAGIDALRDAGIPLTLRYKTTTIGTKLPDRWGLPEQLRDDTGIIFCSAYPGFASFASQMTAYHTDRARRAELARLERIRQAMAGDGATSAAAAEVDRGIGELRAAIAEAAYTFDRRFLFRTLSMGHSQFAEVIGARGPNTQINAACSSTTQAVGMAEDWIRAGRCRRVVVVSADDATNDDLLEWVGSGFLVSGAAATDARVEDAATPFDRRRHGLILGSGAAALVVEEASAAVERGLLPICEVLASVTANSAFHGSRLDVDHISQVMESLLQQAERRWGIDRKAIAPETVFVSHETYTPARGGSAAAEVHALRRAFGAAADQIVVANTKGFTGHALGVGIEDVLAVKSLETGLVPAVPNFREPDPELGPLNLSRGGPYPVRYALRLGAGFGSQISMSLLHLVRNPTRDRRPSPEELGYVTRLAQAEVWHDWLKAVSGYEDPQLEVVRRQLRVKNQGPPNVLPAPSAAARAPDERVAQRGRSSTGPL